MADPKNGVVGKVKWFNNKKGYGFITCMVEDEPADVFIHYRNIRSEEGGYRTLNEGQEVVFTLVKGVKGHQAEDVVITG